jgi:PadR family transcriptional regulator PadR
MSQEVLGGFEHQVLLAILRLGSEAYTVPIVLELEEHAGRTVAPASVYVTLRRLEKKGFLTSRMSPPPPNEGGRERRVFMLEAPALAILRESKRVLGRLWDGLAQLDET